MTQEEQIDSEMDALFKSVSSVELDERYCKLRNFPEQMIDLQKNLLALSFGCYQSGNVEAAKHIYDTAGFLSGFKVRVRTDNDEH